MTDPNHQRADLLVRRLSAVTAASALNAEALRLRQKLAGLEMELLRLELEQDRNSGEADMAAAMAQVRDQLATLERKQNACAGRYGQREREIAEIDRQLAAAMAGLGGDQG
jgi:hypothetical protein